MLHGWINALWFGLKTVALGTSTTKYSSHHPRRLQLTASYCVAASYAVHKTHALHRSHLSVGRSHGFRLAPLESSSHSFLVPIRRHRHSNKWQIRHWHAQHLLLPQRLDEAESHDPQFHPSNNRRGHFQTAKRFFRH